MTSKKDSEKVCRTIFFTLVKLAELGAKDKSVQISTNDLADQLEVSQQTASRHLLELERLGQIQRQITQKGSLIKISDLGMDEIRRAFLNLKSIFEEAPIILTFEGYVFNGLGEGAYYLSLRGYRRQIVKKLGFDPYPGTLNLKLKDAKDIQIRKEVEAYPAIPLVGFENGSRTYGGAKCYKVIIGGKVEGAIITAMRSHYIADVVELIAPQYIRKSLGLKDQDKVSVQVIVPSLQQSST
jgi:riboflavin kinase, archaea type